MSINERTEERPKLHQRFVANEAYLAHPTIVNSGNPDVNPARETERMRGDKPLSPHVLPGGNPLRRF